MLSMQVLPLLGLAKCEWAACPARMAATPCHSPALLYLVSIGHAATQLRRYTAEEYFALEEAGETRHGFFEGEVFAMAGAGIAHNTLAHNIALACRQVLRGKKCWVQMEAVRLAVEENRHYAYPNVMVSCDPHDPHESQQLHSPLIVEVLSPSTEVYYREIQRVRATTC